MKKFVRIKVLNRFIYELYYSYNFISHFIYYKYNQLNDKYSNSVNKIEKFSNLYELKDKGLIMDTPFQKK